MPRPERPLDGDGGPVEQFAAGLRDLREKAGRPGYRQMAARVNYSVATLSAAASGRRLPTLEVTLAYVAACDGDRAGWERRWREAERLTAAPAEGPAPANGHLPSPYPGLATFQAADADLFFGRDALVAELVRRLGGRRFLAIFGPSGAGKSSVVRAGVVPAVSGPAVVLTPGAHPMTELALCLARHAGVPAGRLLDELREEPARARLAVRQGLPGDVADGPDLLVVVDQFEETFATCADPAERAGFVAALLAMCREPEARARVLLVTRADHYARFTEHPALLAAMTDAQLLVGGMSPAELRAAVTGPAERRGARVEGALVATIVAEVTDRPGALPLAAHALREAWRRRQGAVLTLAGYQAAGGVAGAVAHTAEETYDRLTGPEREVAQRVLLRMVDVGEDGLITRRRLPRAELETIDSAPAVIGALAAARLVTTDRDTVEIAHEALIAAWPRLRAWVDARRTELRLHRQLTEAAAVWTGLGRDDGALYRGLRLSTTLEAAIDPTGTEREFLEASRALRDREAAQRQRRSRRLLAALTTVLLVVTALATGAVGSALRAESERARAVARELAAGARAERMTDPELALLLALRAYRLHPDAETESVLRQATADARGVYTMTAHEGTVASIDVSGSRIASADMDGSVKIWDALGRTPPVEAPVSGNFVDFGPEGTLAIACSNPGSDTSQIVLWRPGEPGAGRALAVVPTRVSRVAYSDDGRWVAAVGRDQRIHVWDIEAGTVSAATGFTGDLAHLAFGAGGQLALSTEDGVVRVWKPGTTAPPVEIRLPGESFPTSVAFSPDGRRIVIGGYEKVTVLSADGRGEPETYRGPESLYWSAAFSPDGSRIAAGTTERTVRIWETSDNTRGLALRGHHGAVQDVAFSADGRQLISGSDDTTVRVWDATGAADPEIATFPAQYGTAQISEDGELAAAPTDAGTMALFPVRSPGAATMLPHAPADTLFPALSTGGGAAAASSGDELIHWWRTSAGSPPDVLACGSRPDLLTTNRIVFSGDGRTLVADCGDSEIRLWRADDARQPAILDGGAPVAVNEDATLLAMQRWPQGLVLWDTSTGQPVRTLKGQPERAEDARFSADGRLLAVSSDDGAIRVWTVAEDAEPVLLTGAVGQIAAISFSPDGRLLAAIGTDDVLRLWNTDGSGGALTFDHPPSARQIAFSPDGRQIVTLHDTHIRFMSCEVCGTAEEVVRLAEARVIRDFTAAERAKYLHEPG